MYCRMKSQEHKWDPSHSKYILLRQCKVATTSAATTGGSSCSSSSSSSSMVGSSNAIKKVRGHCIGILVRAEFGPNSLRIHTHSGLYIELKVRKSFSYIIIQYKTRIQTYMHTFKLHFILNN